jgi:RNA polymerase sigma-70 factor (family 1)
LQNILPYGEYSDPQLIEQWLKGEEQAFDILYKKYVIGLLNTAYRKTGSRETARELAQDVFMELYLHRWQLETHSSLHNYLYTILKNKICNYYRHRLVEQKYEQFVQHTQEAVSPDANRQLENKELKKRLHTHIRQLPQQCRTVFMLSWEERLSNKEIAEKLQISVNTVEQHIRKARRLLRDALDDYEFGFVYIYLAAGSALCSYS